MTTPLFQRPRLAFLWIALIPIALTVFAFWVGRQFQYQISWISHSYGVRTAIRETVLLASNAERDLHNYLLTGRESYLRLTKANAEQVPIRLEELRRLVADDPVQRRIIARLQPLVNTRIGEIRQIVNLGSTGELTNAPHSAEIDYSQGLMEEVRGLSRDMMQEEERVLLARTREQSRMGWQAEIIFASAILVTLLLLLWAARLAKDYSAKRDGAELALQQKVAEIGSLNRDLGRRVAERTAELRVSNQELARTYEASRLLASIVESSDDAIVGKSLDGIIRTWNAAAERLYGYKAEEIVGQNIKELVPPDRFGEELCILDSLRNGVRVDHFETVRLRKGGGPIDVSLTISPICGDTGQIVGASDVARDITDQKRNAETLRETQKLESLGVLAGGIAHDFNNLLVGVLGNASLALDQLDSDSPARTRIQEVIGAGESAAALTRQILAYSGRGRFVLDRINLSTHVRDTVPLIRAAISHTVKLALDLAEDLPDIEADMAQLQQVVMNLVINGAESIPDRKPGTVTVATRRQTLSERSVRVQAGVDPGEIAPGLYVMLEVRDTGSGMDEVTQARIFEPFFTTKFTGRGLGLSAVSGIVRGHLGSIQVASAAGQGSVFRVLLPAVASSLEPIPQRHPEAPVTPDLARFGNILVIDDEDSVRKMASQALKHYGYSVLQAENGECGLEVFRRNQDHIQCVVLDLTMPVMSGETTLRCLKSLRADIPVILSSGFCESETVPRFKGQGLAGFIQKPYKASALAEKVKYAIACARVPDVLAGV